MSDNDRNETPADFEKTMKELLTGLSGHVDKQKDLRKKLFRSVFSSDDIERCADTMIDVMLGSLAKHMWASTEDGHPSQALAFDALSDLRRHWKRARASKKDMTTPPPLSAFKELRGSDEDKE